MNHFMRSCIADADTYVLSFAHNENECEQHLKYDIHSKSVSSFQKFYSNFVERLKAIANNSNGSFRAKDCDISRLLSASSFVEMKKALYWDMPGYIFVGGVLIGFELYDISDDEVIITWSCNQYNPSDERRFVGAYIASCDNNIVVSKRVDDIIYENTGWCCGPRFFITQNKTDYVGSVRKGVRRR